MRFHISVETGNDLTEIAEHLSTLSSEPALKIGRSLQGILQLLAKWPLLAHTHEDLSASTGQDIRCITDSGYVIFLAADRTPVLFLGVIYGKRDAETIMRQRLS